MPIVVQGYDIPSVTRASTTIDTSGRPFSLIEIIFIYIILTRL